MKYYERIDGLRFVAIFFVLIEHFAPIIGGNISAGYFGVDLFFVISGYLLSSVLLKTKEVNFLNAYFTFMGRRALRIFPLFYLALFILWLINFENVREHFIWLLTYTYNYAWVYCNIPDTHINHFWSLCVEEQYYILWPIIVLTFRNKPKSLVRIILLIISLGFAQYILNIIPSLSLYNNISLLTRMASLGIGSLGAVYSLNNKLPNKIFKSRIVEIILFIILIITLLISFKLKPLVLAIISLYLVLKSSEFGFSISFIDKFLQNKWVIYMGTISYGIYMFHYPLGHLISTYIFDPLWVKINFENLGTFYIIKEHSWIIKMPLYTICSIIIAGISFRYFEKPFIDLKNKFFKY